MRGSDRQTGSMFSYVSPEALVPADHPLRPIRVLVNRALERRMAAPTPANDSAIHTARQA